MFDLTGTALRSLPLMAGIEAPARSRSTHPQVSTGGSNRPAPGAAPDPSTGAGRHRPGQRSRSARSHNGDTGTHPQAPASHEHRGPAPVTWQAQREVLRLAEPLLRLRALCYGYQAARIVPAPNPGRQPPDTGRHKTACQTAPPPGHHTDHRFSKRDLLLNSKAFHHSRDGPG